MGSHVSNICISNDTVWALTPNGDVLCRYGISKKNPAGDYWRQIPGKFWTLRGLVWRIGARCLSSSLDVTLYLLMQIVHLLSAAKTGEFASLVVSSRNELWGLTNTRFLYRRHVHVLENCKPKRRSGSAWTGFAREEDIASNLEESWEVLWGLNFLILTNLNKWFEKRFFGHS